jgi:hypothetical protein
VDPASEFGALKASELLLLLSCITSLFAVVPLPRIVVSPLKIPEDAVMVEAVMLAEVFTTVLPDITEAPLTVPDVISGAASVLLLRVSIAPSVTTTPLVG